jgi:hypothetical protein
MSYKKLAKNVTDPSLAAWCAALAESSVAVEQVPPGWFTVTQLCEKTGRANATISKRMTDFVRQSKAESRRFRVMTGRGVYPVPHYRLIGK